MSTYILFFVLAFLLVFGVPIALCLGIASMAVLLFVDGAPPLNLLSRSVVTGVDSFPLVAVPLFILAGDLMQKGGLSKRIIGFTASLVGHIRASLTYINVLASMFFAAISGSAPATVAAIGSNLIPEMKKEGYPKDFSAALTASAGIIGVLIPPSIPFIIYGVTAEVSIGKLFLAGVVPGVFLGLIFMVLARVMSRKFLLNENKKESFSAQKVIYSFRESFWALLIPVIILGGIYGGIFTPTEAGAVAVLYSAICGLFIYKDIKIGDFKEILIKSSLTASTVLVLVVFSTAFGRIITIEQIPSQLAEIMLSLSDNPIVILLFVNALLLVVGMFMETISSIIILTPILLPVMVTLGVDPILFGVIMTVNLAIGFCTPPLGVNIFVASQISNTPIETISKRIIPFVISMLMVLMLVTFVPSFSLALPNLIN
ncbi:TRAP transporter large permease [Marinobacterium sedimentorum]|uniref:TRAP transporter large permease n=1 Tax=Marinobacterium sedimentorum TaxID=2927804 RepID=UPI0020C689B5|nr:TRAP transporter large permease [Marinobacterium sedimentorum]MCP8689507.1 TRAP transporter large permease [Marinobacterium sedimentorum]